jgi:hypothetical protein
MNMTVPYNKHPQALGRPSKAWILQQTALGLPITRPDTSVPKKKFGVPVAGEGENKDLRDLANFLDFWKQESSSSISTYRLLEVYYQLKG